MAHFMYPSANPMAHVASPAQAYSAAQGAYVAAAAPAAYATPAASARSGQTYEGYPTAIHSATQYSYSRSQVAVTPAVAYDQSKAYFQPSAATTYTVATAEPQFQAAKTVYTTGPAFTSTQRPAMVAPKLQAAPVSSTATSYVYSSSTPVTTFAASGFTAATTPQAAISGYDAAVYSAAASSLYSQPQQAKTSWFIKKSVGNQFKVRPRGPPKAPQLHYCDVCKISCAGPQTYREHLDGQKHKKKDAAQKASQPTGRQAQHQRKCELCDVTCTGQDAYAAHIRGSKHQKVLKLHTRLGKPIPSSDPVLATTNKTATPGKKPAKTTPTAKDEPKVVAAPRINFLGGTQLKTVGGKVEEVKMTTSEASTPATRATPAFMTSADLSEDEDDGNAVAEKDVHPVGSEYIEDIKNELGKFVTFNCKLCDCKFNDPNAKEMHLKGRRHRLQYKKKVDPSLQVDIKPSIRMKKLQEEKLRRQELKDGYWRHREQQARMLQEMRMEDEIYWGIRRLEMMPVPLHPEYPDWPPYAPLGPGLQPPYPLPPMQMQRPESWDDRHVLTKHSSIYPTEAELQIVQNLVSACEKALKMVSDSLAESYDTNEIKTEDCLANRTLKGVMRVGVLSKGLMLRGDLHVNLVVLCSEKPTTSLLEQVGLILPKHLAAVSTVKYEVRCCVDEACLVVSKESPPAASCTITLTSPVMRQVSPSDGESGTDASDVLNRQKCLEALAALRHSKWFQAKANGLQSSVIIIRVLRNMCQRIPLWTSLSDWAMELLVEKCITTAGGNAGPGDCLRRVFECLASGLLLPGGPGLCDPCEKEPSDVTSNMTSQQREEVTALAQHALRLIAFRQIHKVLGMKPLPAGSYQASHFGNRKRKQASYTGLEGVEKKDRKAKEAETTH